MAVQSNPRPILQRNYRGSTALFLSFYLSGHFITFTLLIWLYDTHICYQRHYVRAQPAHICAFIENTMIHNGDLENFARLANFRGPSQKGDSVCVLTLPVRLISSIFVCEFGPGTSAGVLSNASMQSIFSKLYWSYSLMSV